MRYLKYIPAPILLFIGLFLINSLGASYFKRFDLTQDKRYTLSEPAKQVLDQVKSPLIIDVFLEGKFPAEFRKLQQETRYLLEEFSAYNPNISFYFSNPIEEGTDAEVVGQQFANSGMSPTRVNVRANGEESFQIVFPWATANHNNRAAPVQLLKPILGASTEEKVFASIQNLEYAFINSFNQLLNAKSKSVAILRGNGTLPTIKIDDFIRTLDLTYNVKFFPLDSIHNKPEQTLKVLRNNFDLVVVPKPKQAFTDTQKFVLDQYTMNGGTSLWLLDAVAMENDSLYKNGSSFAFPQDLNINDLFFKYGVRINPVLVNDLVAAPIRLADGEGTQAQYFNAPWFYQPMVKALNIHPITTNIERPLIFRYANQIDTLKSAPQIKKSPLLFSSILTKLEGVPREISLESITIEPKQEDYISGSQLLSVLLEGTFDSAFKNRILPVSLKDVSFRESGKNPSKMIIVADGDLVANDLTNEGRPLELGIDKFTLAQYGNKEFLLNAVNYLLDDDGLINIRSKEIALPFLNTQKTVSSLNKWQVLCIGLPLGFLLVFGIGFYYLRKRRYAA